MFEHLLNVVTKSAPGNDNDFADRLNYRYTAAVYMLMSMAVIGRTYIAEPIECWTPSFFETPWVDYTNNLCFVKSTYYLPMHTPIEEGKANNETYLISYYQWIPLFFMMLAMCFYVPRAVWFNVFSHHFVDINAIVDLLTSFDNAVNPETRDPAVMQVAKHIDRYLNSTVEYRKHPYFKFRKYLSKKNVFVFYCGRRYGLAIATIYLSLKLCYIMIGIVQVYYIDTFLIGDDFSIWNYYTNIFSRSYVIKVMMNLANNETKLEGSPTFPRITMCEFDVRTVGELLTYNVQCVLPLNLFNEKIFLFLWMWIVFVLLMTCTNMIAWLNRIAIAWNREHYIMKHLRLLGKLNEENMRHHKKITKKLMRYFIHHYLRPDGVFLLRLISINTNCLISSEIIGALWENFLDHPSVVKRAETYHSQLQEMGVITEEDENKVLASLKAMNVKASRSTLDVDDDLPPMRAKSTQYSIFDPNSPLSLEAPPEGRKSTAGKRFSSRFQFKDKEASNNDQTGQRRRVSRDAVLDGLEENIQGGWRQRGGQVKKRTQRRGLEVPARNEEKRKPDGSMANFTARTRDTLVSFALCRGRLQRSSSLDGIMPLRQRSGMPANGAEDNNSDNPETERYIGVKNSYSSYIQPSAPENITMGPLQSLLSDQGIRGNLEGRFDPPPYGDVERRKADF